MLALLFLPALIGTIFAIDQLSEDNDDSDDPNAPPEEYDIYTDETILGDDAPNSIDAGAGDDFVDAMGGNDRVVFDEGDDEGTGGAGDDVLFGGPGDDLLTGGPGDDEVFLADGDDASFNVTDTDPPLDEGDDLIRGGAGDDLIVDNMGSNTLYGDTGRDHLDATDAPGTDTPDALFGGYGRDILLGDDGDVMSGGAGDDAFVAWTSDPGAEIVTVSDFDPESEIIFLDFDIDTFGPLDDSDLTHEVLEDKNALMLSVAGKEVALLEGVTTFDPAMVLVRSF